jgi:hypothetical protein
VHEPREAWMLQIGRNLTDAVDGFLLQHRYVIVDRDPLYTRISNDARVQWCEKRKPASSQPQSQRLRGTLGRLSTARVSSPRHSVG